MTVTYEITVANPSTVDTVYDLVDELQFGAGITIDSATVTNTAGGVTVDAGWNGVDATTVATAVPIAAGASHTYQVVVAAVVPLTITAAESDCTVGDGESGTGFLNSATVTHGGEELGAATVRRPNCPIPVRCR